MESRRIFAALIVAGDCMIAAAASAEMNWPRIAAALDLNRGQVHELQEAESRMLGGMQRIERALLAQEIDRERAGELIRSVRGDFEQAWQEIVTEEQQERELEVAEAVFDQRVHRVRTLPEMAG